MAQFKTVEQIIEEVRTNAAGWQNTVILYWNRLHANEKSLIRVLAGSNGSGVVIVDNGGYATISNGVETISVPILEE